MLLGVFREAAEIALGRPVFTHELTDCERLRFELLEGRDAPCLDDVKALIPEARRVPIFAR